VFRSVQQQAGAWLARRLVESMGSDTE
jgi:hypothetical protein